MNSCLYEGTVRHRRLAPCRNEFSYSLFLACLDLSELEEVFRGRWFWSVERSNLASFRRRDHLGDPERPLEECVRDLVEAETGSRPTGSIRLLTHLRYFGYCMNPVSFYFCGSAEEGGPQVVAEVNNTPWGERHCYVLDAGSGRDTETHEFRFDKAFHVSPFMSMSQSYRWVLSEPAEQLHIRMENHESGRMIFDADLALDRRPITSAKLAAMLLRYPFMTAKVISAIYWQALKLWLKKCPFYPHPKHIRA